VRSVLLATDVAGAIIRGRAPEGVEPGRAAISAVTRAELRFGVARRPDATRLSRVVEAFISGIDAWPWGPDAADAYGSLRAHLERVGMTIGIADTMIAAHALVAGATLITANGRHFERVPGLDLLIIPPG
jgi:tRNA(fMet)-specific endonuclease VapC